MYSMVTKLLDIELEGMRRVKELVLHLRLSPGCCFCRKLRQVMTSLKRPSITLSSDPAGRGICTGETPPGS